MYTLDTNINTAIERQADRVRAVQAFSSHADSQSGASSWTHERTGHTNVVSARATMALAASAPLALIVVWGLVALFS